MASIHPPAVFTEGRSGAFPGSWLRLWDATHASVPVCREVTAFNPTSCWHIGGAAIAAQTPVFQTAAWFENLAATCPAPNQTVTILSVRDSEGGTELPLRRERGGKINALSNFYSPLFGPVRTSEAAAVAHAPKFAQWMAQHGTPWLHLGPLDPASPFWLRFSQSLREAGFWTDHHFASANWHYPSNGVDWASYLAGRPSRLRNTIVRTLRKLQADAATRLEVLDQHVPADAMARAVAAFEHVYALSWKRPEPFPDFMASMCKMAHARGWLRVGLCHVGGVPVAAQVWLVKDGVASIFKLAQKAHARRGVGTALSATMFQHVLDVDQVHEVDFLSGDDAYKSEWMACRRERVGLVAFNPRTAQGLAAAAHHFGGKFWRGMRGWVLAGRRRPTPP